MPDLRLYILQQIFLGLLGGHAGDLLQHLQLGTLDVGDLLLGGRHRGKPPGQLLVLALVLLGLAVQGLLLLLKAALLLFEVRLAVLDLSIILGAALMDLFLGLHQHFALLILSALDGLIDDTLGLFLGTADLFLGGTLPVVHSHWEHHCGTDDQANQGEYYFNEHSLKNTSSIKLE
jgi:hypothetical protein